MLIRLLVEGRLDEAVGHRLAAECGLVVEQVYGRQGWVFVRAKIAAFNQAAQFTPCIAMVDFMDTGMSCPPGVVQNWVPDPHPNMVFRVVVRELESWLLADRQGVATFLQTRERYVPTAPEEEDDPKRSLVNLARRSRSGRIRTALVPRLGSSAPVGPSYNPLMERFIRESWNPIAARNHSPSLDKCLTRLEELRARLGG